MFCKSCGKQIESNETFCPHCGAPVEQQSAPSGNYGYTQPTAPVPPAAPAVPQKNTMAIVGFILSFFVAIVGLILSAIGLKKSKELGGSGKGLAIGGIVISVLEIFFTIIIYVAVLGPIFAQMF